MADWQTTITGLSSEENYTIEVFARNSSGDSTAATLNVTTSEYSAPGQPSVVGGTIAQTGCSITFSPVPEGESPSGYKAYKAGDNTQVGIVSSGRTGTTIVLTGFAAGASETVYVFAYDSNGEGAHSPNVTFYLKPADITISVASVTENTITLNVAGGNGATTFEVYSNLTELSHEGLVGGQIVITGLTDTTNYPALRVIGYNFDSSSNTESNTLAAGATTTLVLDAPVITNITATQFDATVGELPGATAYHLFLDGIETVVQASHIFTAIAFPIIKPYGVTYKAMVGGSLTDVSAEARAIPATAPTWGNPTVGDDTNPRGLPYIFVWPAVEGATSYDVEFSFDGLVDESGFGEPNVFINPIHQVFDVAGTSCELPDVAGIRYGKLHYWHVKPKNIYGSGDWSSPLNTFVADVPVPVKVAPLAGAMGTQLPLIMNWTPANPAKWADVLFEWVVYDAAGTIPRGFASDVTTFTYNYEDATGETALLLDVTYQWQVRGYANPLAPKKLPPASDHRWTTKTSFTTGGAVAGAFDVLAPLDAILVSSEPALVDFSWEAAAGAIYYKLYIEEVGSGSPMVYQVDVGTSHSVALAPAKQYTWWVGAWNYAGETVSTSTRTLSTKTMVPTLVSVVCDVTAQTGGTAIAGWSISDDTGVSGYRVKYGTVSGSYTGVSADIAVGTLEASITGLTNGMTYFFVVVSFDGAGVESDISNEKFAMITDEVPPVLAEASFDASAHPAGSRVALSWTIPTEFNRVKIVRAEGGYAAVGTDPETNPDAGVALVCASSDAGMLSFVDDGSNNISSVAISDPIIPGIAIPVAGQTPTTIINAVQFMGTVSWSPADSTFAPNTAYTATITLTPKVGYTLTGVPADFFIVQGATVTNAADSGIVAAVYPATGLLPIDLSAIPGITSPVTGEVPVTTVDSTQYTGTVSWNPTVSGAFAAATAYTATVNLTPKTGYTLTGVPANFFTVNGIAATNGANSGAVAVVFPATAAQTITLSAVPGITNPVTGEVPVTTVDSTQYTGTVSWSPSASTFASNTVYTATVTLTPKTGYTLTGVPANFFTINGAATTSSANSGVVTKSFPATAAQTITLSAIPGISNPVTGAVPVTAVDSTQYTGTVAWSPSASTFALNVVYTATVTLTPKAGYTLTGVSANFFTINGAATTSSADSGVVTKSFAATAQTINLSAIPGINNPVTGAVPVTTVDSTQYTGSVVWSPSASTFASNTVYTATVTLTPKAGYTLTGVPANFFTINGAATTSSADSGVVTKSFATTAQTINLSAIPGISNPVTGATSVTSVDSTQYTGTVAWSPLHNPFQAVTVYTATVTLTPKAGYTLTGVPVNFFTVNGIAATNSANSGAATVIFPATAAQTITLSAIPGVTSPATGATAVAYAIDATQYTGTVYWTPAASTFAATTVYTANISLTAKTGYTLTGVPANFFTVNGIAATNSASSGSVSVAFPATAAIAWSAVGSGISGDVRALAVFNNELYAGGNFSTAGGVAVNNIAKWNDSSWSAVGSGMNSSISAFAIFNNELYAGGAFTTASGAAANYIAKWNGSSWSTLGSGVNNNVSALTVYNNELYVGGYFTTAGGSAANYIAKWNGSSWSTVSSQGMSYAIISLTVYNNEVYAGGSFSTAGGVAAERIAKWDGSNWSALGSGTNSDVQAFAEFNGELYVGGSFTTAGGLTASRTAKWNGFNWAGIGSGINNGVQGLAVFDNELYACGYFATGDGSAANYIAKWNGSGWVAIGAGANNAIRTLQVFNNKLYAGGNFSNINGVYALRIAKLG